MKLRVKDMDIATGGGQIVILNQRDAELWDLHHMDRLGVRKGKRKTVAVLDIAESKKAVPPGRIGFFEEVLDALNAKHGDIVEISLERKPASIMSIRKKLDGEALTGPNVGLRLEMIPEAYVSFWFAFSTFYPDLVLWAPEG